jgi:putative SOS response-associated peptidase YedK
MCNLYRLTKPGSEVAHLFDVLQGHVGNAGPEVYPGYPGLVVANGELRSMVWGFPLVLKGKNGQPLKPKPVQQRPRRQARRLHVALLVPERRCLIPVSAFAEAEGEKGAKTRTWFTLPGEEVFAVAGLWRDTPEMGPGLHDGDDRGLPARRRVHDRMPVILKRRDWARLARRPARCGGPAVPALSGADGGGADGGELGAAVGERAAKSSLSYP